MTQTSDINKYVGNHFIFKIDNIVTSGFFCGIGKINDDYGMIFINSSMSNHDIKSCLFVHPSKTKCVLQSNMIKLRSLCRNYFKENKLDNNLSNYYFPPFDIKEICYEERNTTKR